MAYLEGTLDLESGDRRRGRQRQGTNTEAAVRHRATRLIHSARGRRSPGGEKKKDDVEVQLSGRGSLGQTETAPSPGGGNYLSFSSSLKEIATWTLTARLHIKSYDDRIRRTNESEEIK